MNTRISRIILIISLLTIFISLLSFSNDKDSINFLRQQCAIDMSRYDYNSLGDPALKLLRMAEKSGSKDDLAYGNLVYGIHNLFNGDPDKVERYLKKATELANETGNDSILAIGLNSLGVYEAMVHSNLYVAQRYFTRALHDAQKIKKYRLECSIYNNLAQVSLLLKDAEGIKYARSCYELGKKYKDLRSQYLGSEMLAEYYYLQQNYVEARNWLDTAKKLRAENNIKMEGHVTLLEGKIQRELHNYEEAESIILSAINIFENEEKLYVPTAQYELGILYRMKGEVERSIDALNKAVEYCERLSSYDNISNIYTTLASNYAQLGNYAKAYAYQQMSLDSLNSHETKAQRHLDKELTLMMELADKEMTIVEKDKEATVSKLQISSLTKTVIFLLIILILMIIGLVYILVSHRKRMILNRAIVMQHRKTMELEDEIKQIETGRIPARKILADEESETATSLDEESETNKGNVSGISEDTSRRIYTEAVRLMEEEKLYCDQKFTREDFIERLGTNRTYLSRIIRERSGMNFSQWINSYRIKEAIRILGNKDRPDYPINQLYADVGFGSPTPFFKLFQETTGLTPSAYRKQLQSI